MNDMILNRMLLDVYVWEKKNKKYIYNSDVILIDTSHSVMEEHSNVLEEMPSQDLTMQYNV
jgi:hypothetical protein